MSTFITRYDTAGPGVRLAVKDLIDMEGEITTAGCAAVAKRATPAARDALCLRGARAARARIVGRTNLHELALGVSGVNPWFGTPVNPLDPALVPGGSSSGSAVAVANDEADVAYGSDTGGSIRIPAACCGIAGLKTTFARVPLDGVWPLSPSLDTVGPMAKGVAGLVLGMELLEPGFSASVLPAADTADLVVGRLVLPADPLIDAALDEALRVSGWRCEAVVVPEWDAATRDAGQVLVVEAHESNAALLAADPEGIGPDVRQRLVQGGKAERSAVDAARRGRARWRAALDALFDRYELLVTPTLSIFPPALAAGQDLLNGRCTMPVNLAGVPALSLPVPSARALPASVQLIGPEHSEARLLAAGAWLESAVAAG